MAKPEEECQGGDASAPRLRHRQWVPVAALTVIVVVLWWLPRFWYTSWAAGSSFRWFQTSTNIAGWQYTAIPISKTAEAFLVADRLENGQLNGPDRQEVSIYSAKRYVEKENEIGLFSHTPDRCWTEAGWKLEPQAPDYVELDVHGLRMLLERRVFAVAGRRELVYFTAVVGGKALPYRLNQYHRVGQKQGGGALSDSAGTLQRLLQARLWGWAWESFCKRAPLGGPQQFVRLSTPIGAGGIERADERLRQILPLWLQPGDYTAEQAAWQQGGGK